MSNFVVQVILSGGCEILFGTRSLTRSVADGTSLKKFVGSLRECIAERPDQFLVGDSLRPGILTLVNDTDAELLGGDDYPLAANDVIQFVSTLHGG